MADDARAGKQVGVHPVGHDAGPMGRRHRLDDVGRQPGVQSNRLGAADVQARQVYRELFGGDTRFVTQAFDWFGAKGKEVEET